MIRCSRFLLPPFAFFLLGAVPAQAIPIAVAGADQTIFGGTSALLSGSAIDDGDPIIDYEWSITSQPAGSAAVFDNPFKPGPIFFPDSLGSYDLALVVTDAGFEVSAADSVTITVVENLPPVVIAAANPLSGVVPFTVQFDGSQSFDPEGFPLSYQWSFGDGSLPSDEESPVHSFRFAGEYSVTFRVLDSFGQGATDTLTISARLPMLISEPGSGPLFVLGLGALGVLAGWRTRGDRASAATCR